MQIKIHLHMKSVRIILIIFVELC